MAGHPVVNAPAYTLTMLILGGRRLRISRWLRLSVIATGRLLRERPAWQSPPEKARQHPYTFKPKRTGSPLRYILVSNLLQGCSRVFSRKIGDGGDSSDCGDRCHRAENRTKVQSDLGTGQCKG